MLEKHYEEREKTYEVRFLSYVFQLPFNDRGRIIRSQKARTRCRERSRSSRERGRRLRRKAEAFEQQSEEIEEVAERCTFFLWRNRYLTALV